MSSAVCLCLLHLPFPKEDISSAEKGGVLVGKKLREMNGPSEPHYWSVMGISPGPSDSVLQVPRAGVMSHDI